MQLGTGPVMTSALQSPRPVSVAGAPPCSTKDRPTPSWDARHPPSMLMIQAASLWNGNRNRTTYCGGDDFYPAEPASPVTVGIGFDTGFLPPTTHTIGFGGPPRSRTRTGQCDPMARFLVEVGRRADLIGQPAVSRVEGLSLCTRGCHPAQPTWHLSRHDCHSPPMQLPTEPLRGFISGKDHPARDRFMARIRVRVGL